jgi:hypothetical protein
VRTVQAAFLAALILALGLAVRPTGAAAVSTGACAALTVGPPQEVVSDARRDALGLAGWPDGTLGPLPRGDGTYDFYAMDAFGGSGPPQRMTVSHGTLDDPLSGGISSRLPLADVPGTYQWAGGATVYRDPATGMIIQALHLERYHADPSTFWSVLGLGRVDPQTGQTTYLGDIISPELSFDSSNAHRWTADLGMPSFTIADHGGVPWFHFYFADFSEPQADVFAADGLSVAGAPVSEVLDAARRGTVSAWHKLYQGQWTSPALGGPSDDLQTGQSQAWAPRVVHSNELNAYFMGAATNPHAVVLSTSTNGISGWSPRVQLFTDPGYYNAYVSLIGSAGTPSDLGHDFYLYYTQWPSPTPDWSNAHLLRRAIHCAPAPPAPPPPPPSPGKAAPRGLRLTSAKVSWRRHRLHLRVRGRLLLPAGVAQCRGGVVRATLRLGKAKRPQVRSAHAVTTRCAFTVVTSKRVRHRPSRVRLAVTFLGNQDLSSLAARSRRLRVRR